MPLQVLLLSAERQTRQRVKATGRQADSGKLDGGKSHGGKSNGGTSNGRKAGSMSSSGLRREVQDSLSELERLIEQQHRQVSTHVTFAYIET